MLTYGTAMPDVARAYAQVSALTAAPFSDVISALDAFIKKSGAAALADTLGSKETGEFLEWMRLSSR